VTEPTRPLPKPTLDDAGHWHSTSTLSPKSMTTRAAISLPPDRVMPVIIVPGIMGTNLRATTDPSHPQNQELAPGEIAWRPPNGNIDAAKAVKKWNGRNPSQRQYVLAPDTLEVDDGGEIDPSLLSAFDGLDKALAQARWWGEIHWDSYGQLLTTLEHNLNKTFLILRGGRAITEHWVRVNQCDRNLWGASSTSLTAPLTATEFEKFASYHYPVYACGYNWLQSNEESVKRLAQRIDDILQFWSSRRQTCTQVILVTHSMGGLVARACARQMEDKIAGVIHGVMPALGAPACYRRIACGTESSNPSNGKIGNGKAWAFSIIAGESAALTTPVMAVAPGPLELLPNHLYPRPWLFATGPASREGRLDYVPLAVTNPYDLYRETSSWYRLIDPSKADPANKYKGKVMETVKKAVKQAERFHKEVLETYYHPKSFAYYCDDPAQLTFGAFRWQCDSPLAGKSSADINAAKPESSTFQDNRNVSFFDGSTGFFRPMAQDAAGDGTVPLQSGSVPSGKVLQLFATRGYDHQSSYRNEAMLALTQHLIVKIVQGVS